MNILEIKPYDVVNGKGIRSSIWVAGCSHHCKGCWSPHTWNPNQGYPYASQLHYIRDIIRFNKVEGFSILGGDPFYSYIENKEPDIKHLLKYIKAMSQEIKQKDLSIWVWTGYSFEFIKDNYPELLDNIDVLIDGKFEEDKKDLTLRYKGSSNQRVIDVALSLKYKQVILYSDD